MEKISKHTAVKFILSELKKGNLDAPNIMGKLRTDWEVTKSSFYRYWNDANEIFTQHQSLIKKELLKEDTRLAKQRLKKDILTRDERMEIATKIARGEALGKDDEKPKIADRLKALDYLSKLDGDFAPKTLEVSAKAPILPILTVRLDA